MGDHSPALDCFEVNVGGQHIGLRRAVGGHDFNALDDAVNANAQGLHAAHMFNAGAYRAVRKHRFKTTSDRQRADPSRTAWVDADDVVFIGPAGHEFVDVTESQGFVKRGFGLVCMAGVGQGGFSCSHEWRSLA